LAIEEAVLEVDGVIGPTPPKGEEKSGEHKRGERKRWRTLQQRIERARELRRAGNHAEQAVWELLCTHPLVGLRFQRQLAIGPYVAPFACTARKLVIEIDGEADPRREQLLGQLGWRVMRLAADDVLRDPQEAWRQIERFVDGR
jgi:very-short-patch-repair endonuclease